MLRFASLNSLFTAVYFYARLERVRTGDKTSHLSYSKLLVCACSDPGNRFCGFGPLGGCGHG